MTIPDTALGAPAVPAKPAPLWEDFIDIFYAPSSVYERRRNANPWPVILILTVVFTVIMIFTFGAMEAAVEAELRDQATKAMATNPRATQDGVDASVKIGLATRKWGGVFTPIGMLISALLVWVLAKIVGAKEETYQRALVVVAYATVIAVVQQLFIGAQGLLMDVGSLTTPDKLAAGPVRFMDKATTSPILYSVAKAIDLFGIWTLIVMAIGVRVTGRATKNQAITFAIVWFSVTALVMAAWGARTAAAAG
jgi:hypothetical protein